MLSLWREVTERGFVSFGPSHVCPGRKIRGPPWTAGRHPFYAATEQFANGKREIDASIQQGTAALAGPAPGTDLVKRVALVGAEREAGRHHGDLPQVPLLDHTFGLHKGIPEPGHMAHINRVPAASAAAIMARASAASMQSGFSLRTCLPWAAAASVTG